MRFISLFSCIAVVLMLVACSGANVLPKSASDTMTFGESWNLHCGDYGFDDNSTVTPDTTLGDMYNGANFTADIMMMDYLLHVDLGCVYTMSNLTPETLYIWYDGSGDDWDNE
jgi:hypothetical protein